MQGAKHIAVFFLASGWCLCAYFIFLSSRRRLLRSGFREKARSFFPARHFDVAEWILLILVSILAIALSSIVIG